MGILRDKAEKLLDDRLDLVLNEAGSQSVQSIQQDLSAAYPPASAPGTSPHYRTGNLFRGVEYAVDKATETVSVYVKRWISPMVAYWLEFGTSKMAARPFMTPNMLDESNLQSSVKKL